MAKYKRNLVLQLIVRLSYPKCKSSTLGYLIWAGKWRTMDISPLKKFLLPSTPWTIHNVMSTHPGPPSKPWDDGRCPTFYNLDLCRVSKELLLRWDFCLTRRIKKYGVWYKKHSKIEFSPSHIGLILPTFHRSWWLHILL